MAWIQLLLPCKLPASVSSSVKVGRVKSSQFCDPTHWDQISEHKDLESGGPALSCSRSQNSLNVHREVFRSSSNVLGFLRGGCREIGRECGRCPLELIIKGLFNESSQRSGSYPVSQESSQPEPGGLTSHKRTEVVLSFGVLSWF